MNDKQIDIRVNNLEKIVEVLVNFVRNQNMLNPILIATLRKDPALKAYFDSKADEAQIKEVFKARGEQ